MDNHVSTLRALFKLKLLGLGIQERGAKMDKNTKLVLMIAGGIFIGLSAYASLERYLVFKQIEHITTNMTEDLQKSSEQSRKRMQAVQLEQQHRQQAKVAETNRIKALSKQKELEKNLLCAKNVDTGKCVCYDKRSGTPVSMSLEQCNQYVDQQFSSYY